MSNYYIQYEAAKYRQAELIAEAEQYRAARRAVRALRSDAGSGEGGARAAHPRGVRLFRRAPRPTAC